MREKKKRLPPLDKALMRRIWSPLTVARLQRTATLRMLARWVKARGYWPTIGEMCKARANSRRRQGQEFTAACHAIKLNILDAIESGEVMRLRIGHAVALTDKGWNMMPKSYVRTEPWLPPDLQARKRVIRYRGFLKGYLQEAEKDGRNPLTLMQELKETPCSKPLPSDVCSPRSARSGSADGSSSVSPSPCPQTSAPQAN